MYRPNGLIQLEPTKMKSLAKSVVAFFLTINFFWGVDCGFTKLLRKKWFRWCSKIASISISICIAFLMSTLLTKKSLLKTDDAWHITIVMQYIIYFFIFHLTNYTVYDLCINIQEIDGNIRELKSEMHGIIFWIFTLIFYAIKFYLALSIQSEEQKQIWATTLIPIYIYCFCYLITDMIPVILAYVYYYLYCCIKNFKMDIQKKNLHINLIELKYKAIVECYYKIIPMCDKMVS